MRSLSDLSSINLYFVLGPLFTGIPIEDQRICRRWFGSLLAAASSLLQCLAFVLLLRSKLFEWYRYCVQAKPFSVYALYEQERRIAFILVGLFMTLLIGQAIMGPLVITNVSFNCICDTTDIYPPVVFVWFVRFFTTSVGEQNELNVSIILQYYCMGCSLSHWGASVRQTRPSFFGNPRCENCE